MLRRLHAVVTAVRDVKEATKLYSDLFGLKASPPETLPELGIRRTVFPLDGTFLELAEPLGSDAPIAHFLDKRGEGVYLIAFEVDNLDKQVADLRRKGVEVNVPEPPSSGFRLLGELHRIAFVHPRFTRGVLIDLVEPQVE